MQLCSHFLTKKDGEHKNGSYEQLFFIDSILNKRSLKFFEETLL